jgi:hypothetical protein
MLMASMMQRLTVKELKQLLSVKDDKEYIGYLFAAQEDSSAPEHQVLVFYQPIKPL